MQPTPQQTACIDALFTDRHLCWQARAGCGKSSTIYMGIQAVASANPQCEQLVVAYNKAIADEFSARLKAGGYPWQQAQASTLHALGFGLIRFALKSQVDDRKVWKLINDRRDAVNAANALMIDTPPLSRPDNVYQIYAAQIETLVGYAKQAGVGFFDDMAIGNSAVWYRLMEHFDVNGFEDTTTSDQVVIAAQQIYRDSLLLTDTIDYNDMILFPLIKNLRVKYTKDKLYIDEAQDLSRARQALARKFVKPGGQIIVVGDDKQAIYGFAGSDAEALSNFNRELDTIIFPLSVTWRCPKSVVALAQSIVPDLEAAPTAPEGEVITLDSLPSDLAPGDAILCRNTAPLIDIAYSLIRSGKACKVEGRKIGKGLIDLVQRWKVSSTDALRNRLKDYKEREMQKALAKGSEQRASEIEDRVQTIFEIIKAVNSKGQHTVLDVVDFINSLFADEATGVIILCTYHRAKGREWLRVILYEHYERCPSKFARQAWQKEQESNLAYVAITRAKQTLMIVKGKPKSATHC